MFMESERLAPSLSLPRSISSSSAGWPGGTARGWGWKCPVWSELSGDSVKPDACLTSPQFPYFKSNFEKEPNLIRYPRKITFSAVISRRVAREIAAAPRAAGCALCSASPQASPQAGLGPMRPPLSARPRSEVWLRRCGAAARGRPGGDLAVRSRCRTTSVRYRHAIAVREAPTTSEARCTALRPPGRPNGTTSCPRSAKDKF